MSRQIATAIVLIPLTLPLTLTFTPSLTQPFTPALAQANTGGTIARLKRSNQRWIEVDLSRQTLIAWQGNRWIDAKYVSTGKASTPTYTGVFYVQTKLYSTTMSGRDYSVPDVRYVMFYDGNYAIHGAYWHNRFGTPVSHGCINLAEDAAKWLYNWSSVGTPVVIHD
ncbi:MAG: L,D-transpeptidase [Synechococcales bacterium]|nr:L,D-transpeptidase [Synechococcales bacterium]